MPRVERSRESSPCRGRTRFWSLPMTAGSGFTISEISVSPASSRVILIIPVRLGLRLGEDFDFRSLDQILI